MGTGTEGLTRSTGEYPQLVTIHIFIQADGTDIILVSWEKQKGVFTEPPWTKAHKNSLWEASVELNLA